MSVSELIIVGQVFKLNTPALGILSSKDGERLPIRIPASAIVTVLEADGNGSRFVDVEWKGKTLTMFAVDLSKRGVELEAEQHAN